MSESDLESKIHKKSSVPDPMTEAVGDLKHLSQNSTPVCPISHDTIKSNISQIFAFDYEWQQSKSHIINAKCTVIDTIIIICIITQMLHSKEL